MAWNSRPPVGEGGAAGAPRVRNAATGDGRDVSGDGATVPVKRSQPYSVPDVRSSKRHSTLMPGSLLTNESGTTASTAYLFSGPT